MSRQAANRLIVVLAALVAVLAVAVTILWQRQRAEQTVDESNLPTRAATALMPTPTPPTLMPTMTPLPTATAVASSPAAPTAVAFTVTPIPTTHAFTNHTVQRGETLTIIATQYNVSIAAIVDANSLANPDTLYAGQILRIPLSGTATPISQLPPATQAAPTAAASPTAVAPIAIPQPDWPPSVLRDGVAENYPLTRTIPASNITLHYQPGTYPAQQIESLAPTIAAIWGDVQTQLGQPFAPGIDVYLAGTLFALNPFLQGMTYSWEYRSFILLNGTFHPGEEQYILSHELTHIAATHLLGPASSNMLHEGLAVHLPQAYLTQQAGYLPHTEICAALLGTPEFKTAVQMHDFAYNASGFGGHSRTYFHYNLAGCFVAYLLETYGLEPFDALYDSGDYEGVYGRSLVQLDEEWQAWLATIPVTVDAQQLINGVNNVAIAYQEYMDASAGGVHANWEAYMHLNRARLAANQGQFAQADAELATFYALFASAP